MNLSISWVGVNHNNYIWGYLKHEEDCFFRYYSFWGKPSGSLLFAKINAVSLYSIKRRKRRDYREITDQPEYLKNKVIYELEQHLIMQKLKCNF